jgi:hypothetical protein
MYLSYLQRLFALQISTARDHGLFYNFEIGGAPLGPVENVKRRHKFLLFKILEIFLFQGQNRPSI